VVIFLKAPFGELFYSYEKNFYRTVNDIPAAELIVQSTKERRISLEVVSEM
jgi:hypothetical protein